MKVGSCAIFLDLKGFLRHTTPHLWHLLGAYFLLIWGVGVVKIVFTHRMEEVAPLACP